MLETIYAGYLSEHPSTFTCHIDKGHDNWTIINTISEFEFLMDTEWITLPPNQIVIFPPYTSGDYRACGGRNFINNWVSFNTDEKYILNTLLPFAVPIEINAPDIMNHLFHMIAAENFFSHEYREQSINHLFHLLFYKINESYTAKSTTLSGELYRIRFDMQSNPAFNWSVPYIAKQLNISTGYLQNLYKKNFGISCMEDVYQRRMELAKDYIIHSTYSINEIAEICGYQNTEHFCRQFKRITGMTASEFRSKGKGIS